jgi:esterase
MTALSLAALEWGSGAPLVVLHGVFGTGRNWSTVGQHLAARHRVLALDARNHGASPWADSMSYPEMADDVGAFMAERRLRRTALLGHSMGGKTAMLQALLRGETVERLVVVDVAPVTYRPTLQAYARAMLDLPLEGVARRSEVDGQLARAIPDAAERAFLLQNLVFEEGRAHWRLNLPVIERAMPILSSFPELPPGTAFPGPALFIAGERSAYMRPEHRPVIERLFPKAQLVTIPGAGHWVHAERREAFLDLVTPFLSGGN